MCVDGKILFLFFFSLVVVVAWTSRGLDGATATTAARAPPSVSKCLAVYPPIFSPSSQTYVTIATCVLPDDSWFFCCSFLLAALCVWLSNRGEWRVVSCRCLFVCVSLPPSSRHRPNLTFIPHTTTVLLVICVCMLLWKEKHLLLIIFSCDSKHGSCSHVFNQRQQRQSPLLLSLFSWLT